MYVQRALITGLLLLTPGTQSALAAEPPDPVLHNVPAVITLVPDGSAPYTVHLEDLLGPVEGANVEVEFSEDAATLIAWTDGQTQPIVSGLTDPNGDITFFFSGSGCIDPDEYSGPTFIAEVRADVVVLNRVSVNSPDAVNSNGLLPTQLGHSICEDGRSGVGLSDAVFHTGPIKHGEVAICSKFYPPFADPVGLDDAVFLTPYIKQGVWGPCQP